MTESADHSTCLETSHPQFKELDRYIDRFHIDPKDPRRKDTLIMTLHHAQEIFGYLPEIVQTHIARKYYIPFADVIRRYQLL
jgi:NADH:ubiquinone oxidoreductase subunit E